MKRTISLTVAIPMFILIATVWSAQALATCTAYCKPGISRACGNGCVSIHKKCRTPWTTACNGNRPATAKKYYTEPKKIEPSDLEKLEQKAD